MSRKNISPKVRLKVYEKYKGHCAYCGCELNFKDMQVDHIEPIYRSEYFGKEVEEGMSNYMPACRQCNFYKSTFTLEQFRQRLTDVMMPNLQKEFNYKLALKYKLITENIKPIKFYFEDCEVIK